MVDVAEAAFLCPTGCLGTGPGGASFSFRDLRGLQRVGD
jgi:hypothetical protein